MYCNNAFATLVEGTIDKLLRHKISFVSQNHPPSSTSPVFYLKLSQEIP